LTKVIFQTYFFKKVYLTALTQGLPASRATDRRCNQSLVASLGKEQALLYILLQ